MEKTNKIELTMVNNGGSKSNGSINGIGGSINGISETDMTKFNEYEKHISKLKEEIDKINHVIAYLQEVLLYL